MNVHIVDTSVWISFFRGETIAELELALKEARVILSPIVAAELVSGARHQAEEKWLAEFFLEIGFFPTPFEHWIRVGHLRSELAKKGLGTSIPDAHIAQCALDVDGYLMSQDKIFEKMARIVPLKIMN